MPAGPPCRNLSTEVSVSVAKRAWARLIKHVYEVDPLVCPRCMGSMGIIAFTEQPEVIRKILTHLGLWPAHVHSPPTQSIAASSTRHAPGVAGRRRQDPRLPGAYSMRANNP